MSRFISRFRNKYDMLEESNSLGKHNMDSCPLPLSILNGASISTPYIIFTEPFSKYYLSLIPLLIQ